MPTTTRGSVRSKVKDKYGLWWRFMTDILLHGTANAQPSQKCSSIFIFQMKVCIAFSLLSDSSDRTSASTDGERRLEGVLRNALQSIWIQHDFK